VQDTKLSKRQSKYICTLLSAAGSLMALINDFLDFSKIEAGYMTLENLPMVCAADKCRGRVRFVHKLAHAVLKSSYERDS
jgi:signal transduction histidine kinase